MRLIKTLLRHGHRYLGIPLGFMFTLWFVSAFFMIYTGGMPRITPDQRIDGMQAIDFSRVRLDLAQALQQAGFDAGYPPEAASLRSILGRPVYVLGEPGYNPVFVTADSGDLLAPLSVSDAARMASDFLDIPGDRFRHLETIETPDQWTLGSQRELPLYRFAVDDGLGTQVYVSPREMQVSVYTTRQSRMLAWLGTIPHWLYFERLRNNQPLWYGLIVYSAYAGCLVALMGLGLGVLQWRKVRPFSLARAIPYRGGHRWHYVVGCLFGLFTLSWVFSGLVSMEPWAWTNADGLRLPRTVLQDPLQAQRFARPAELDLSGLPARDIKSLEFRMVLGSPYLLASYSVPADAGSSKRDRLHQPYNINGQSAAASVLLAADSGRPLPPLANPALVERLAGAVPQATVTQVDLLETYDDYYYSRQGQLPLPVLRVQFDDPARSWVYLDPARGELLSIIHQYSRIERWLYSGLHSLDFAFWYHKRPWWDLGVILLLCGGLVTSVLGLWLGLRRLGQDLLRLRRYARALLPGGKSVHVTH